MVDRGRAWRAVDADLFRFTTTDLRDLHVALMTAFEDAAVLAPALNLEQVRAALTASGWDEPVSDDVLQRALSALVEWRLLESTQDHGAHYATPEEFERKNLQWSLTGRGETAIGGLLHALDALRHAVGLQPAVLDAIGDGLADLAELLRSTAAGTEGRIHVRLAEVESHMASLVTSVRQFTATSSNWSATTPRVTTSSSTSTSSAARCPTSRSTSTVSSARSGEWRSPSSGWQTAPASPPSSIGPWSAPTWLRSPAMTPRRRGWPSGPGGGRRCRRGSPRRTTRRPGSPACSTSPVPPSSSSSGSWSAAGTAGAERRRLPRTSNASRRCSRPRPAKPRPTASSGPPSACGLPATPT